MSKTAIITGISGQDGAYLADLLLKKKYKVVGIARSKDKNSLCRLRIFGLLNKITLIKGDILDAVLIKKILLRYKPEEFYNLAGQSSVAESWKNPVLTFKTNALAVVQILELIKTCSPHSRFFQASSAEIFGDSKVSANEKSTPFNPLNPYGTAKLAAHLTVKNFREQYGIFACNGILFNHESPLRPDYMVSKKIVRGVVRISSGLDNKIILGNIKISRDWGYAGDFVQAMWLMLRQKQPRDFVISTGKNFTVEQFVAEAFRCVGIKKWRQFIAIDKKLVRKVDIKNMRGSSSLIQRELGWKPAVNFKHLVKMMVDHEIKSV